LLLHVLHVGHPWPAKKKAPAIARRRLKVFSSERRWRAAYRLSL
jgi:hypothetical protein